MSAKYENESVDDNGIPYERSWQFVTFSAILQTSTMVKVVLMLLRKPLRQVQLLDVSTMQ